jgi:hypothetical protein
VSAGTFYRTIACHFAQVEAIFKRRGKLWTWGFGGACVVWNLEDNNAIIKMSNIEAQRCIQRIFHHEHHQVRACVMSPLLHRGLN